MSKEDQPLLGEELDEEIPPSERELEVKGGPDNVVIHRAASAIAAHGPDYAEEAKGIIALGEKVSRSGYAEMVGYLQATGVPQLREMAGELQKSYIKAAATLSGRALTDAIETSTDRICDSYHGSMMSWENGSRNSYNNNLNTVIQTTKSNARKFSRDENVQAYFKESARIQTLPGETRQRLMAGVSYYASVGTANVSYAAGRLQAAAPSAGQVGVGAAIGAYGLVTSPVKVMGALADSASYLLNSFKAMGMTENKDGTQSRSIVGTIKQASLVGGVATGLAALQTETGALGTGAQWAANMIFPNILQPMMAFAMANLLIFATIVLLTVAFGPRIFKELKEAAKAVDAKMQPALDNAWKEACEKSEQKSSEQKADAISAKEAAQDGAESKHTDVRQEIKENNAVRDELKQAEQLISSPPKLDAQEQKASVSGRPQLSRQEIDAVQYVAEAREDGAAIGAKLRKAGAGEAKDARRVAADAGAAAGKQEEKNEGR